MDSGLDENESELGVGVLSVSVEMLSHRHGLLDKVVEILGNLGGKASLSAVFKTFVKRCLQPIRGSGYLCGEVERRGVMGNRLQ